MANQASAETFGDLVLGAGGSIISVGNGTVSTDTTALTFGTLTRTAGATVDFVAENLGATAGPLGSSSNRITFSGSLPGQMTVTKGNILPYAVVTSPAGLADFASNLGSGSVGAFPSSDYINGISASTSPLDVVKQTAADTKTLASASKTVAALLLDPGASGSLLTLGTGVTLTVGRRRGDHDEPGRGQGVQSDDHWRHAGFRRNEVTAS